MNDNDGDSRTKGGCEMWGWQGDYCLQRDYNIDTSHSLWNEIDEDEDSLLHMLQEQTPVKDCMDFGCNFSDVDGNAKKVLEDSRESSQLKRRRVLQFTSDYKGAGVGSEQNSSFNLTSKASEGAPMEDAVPENSQWHSSFLDDRCSFGNERLEQSPEGWLSNCFNESVMLCSQDEMNDFIACNGQTGASEFWNIPSEAETDLVQQSPAPGPRRIIRGLLGRESLIKPPLKLTTSVAYPFALIKPCEVQGDVTLKDINQRIHTPPPSKSKNKKDEAASYPTSAFTGKPVVLKTKIRTDGGKGSITIMRTRG